MHQPGLSRAVKAVEGLGLNALEFQQRTNTLSACSRNDSSLPRTGLNHWKYQNNDEVTFPEQ